MEKASKEMLREFVNSQHFTSTTEIMNSMKELFSDVLQQVMEAELEEKLGYEKSERMAENAKSGRVKNYRNGYIDFVYKHGAATRKTAVKGCSHHRQGISISADLKAWVDFYGMDEFCNSITKGSELLS